MTGVAVPPSRPSMPDAAVPFDRTAALAAARRQTVGELALPCGSLAAFVLAAALAPLRGDRARPVVLVAMLVVVAASALAGGRLAAAATALVASLSFDFVHVAPYGVLSLRGVAGPLLVSLLIAFAFGTRRR